MKQFRVRYNVFSLSGKECLLLWKSVRQMPSQACTRGRQRPTCIIFHIKFNGLHFHGILADMLSGLHLENAYFSSDDNFLELIKFESTQI